MDESSNLATLIAYKVWADEVFYTALSELPSEELTVDRPMLYDNVMALLNHVYCMDLVWKAHLQGREHGFNTRNPQTSASFSQLREFQTEVNEWYLRYADGLSADCYHEVIEFRFIGSNTLKPSVIGISTAPNSGTNIGRMTRMQILQHIVNHAIYHRGHIEGVLHQLSTHGPSTDLPVFLRHLRNQGI